MRPQLTRGRARALRISVTANTRQAEGTLLEDPRRSTSMRTRATGDEQERVLAEPPCRMYTPGIERPANARWTRNAWVGARVFICVGRERTDKGGDTVLPRSGDVLRVTREASVQFTEPMMFRVIRVHDWQTIDGWAWLDGYQLDSTGDAVERRSIFVLVNGLQTPAMSGAR